jgi:hypothetical protein
VRLRPAATALLAAAVRGGCGSSSPATSAAGGGVPAALAREARPIGRGPRVDPPASGPVIGDCRRRLGRRAGAHVEVFGAGRVVLIAAGIGALPPLRLDAGRVTGARCFGALATIDPTGLVLVRTGARPTLADLFRSWGQPLTVGRLASFRGAVRVYVGGRRVGGDPPRVALSAHAEIVLEVGPFVPPHRAYRFPPGA